MAIPSKRVVVLIALSLLLQQFSPAYTTNLRTNNVTGPNSSYDDEGEDDYDEDEFEDEIEGKYFILHVILSMDTYTANVECNLMKLDV